MWGVIEQLDHLCVDDVVMSDQGPPWCQIDAIELRCSVLALRIEANFEPSEAVKCLYWIRQLIDVEGIPNDPSQIDGSHDAFHQLLGDGMILCK